MEYMRKILIKFIAFALGYIIGTILWKALLKIRRKKRMKTNLKIGQEVKDQDGDIAIITGIYERDEAPNEILIHLEELDIDIMEYECNLEVIK